MAFQKIGLEAIFDISSFTRSAGTYRSEIKSLNRVTVQTSDSMSAAGSSFGNVGAIAGGAALAGVAALAAGMVGLGAAGVSVSIAQEQAFASVSKVVDGLANINADGLLELTAAGLEFDQALSDLSKKIPATFDTLAETAGLGAQLGITVGLDTDDAQETLVNFAESITRTSVSTGIDEGELATVLAQVTNVYAGSVDDRAANVEHLGNAVVELGNNSATTETQILRFTQRIAGAGNSAGLTQANILGIGAAFSSVGITAETGGTAVSKALAEIDSIVKGSSDTFADNTGAIGENNEAQQALIEKLTLAKGNLQTMEAQSGITGRSLLDQRAAFIAAGGAAEDFGDQLGATEGRGLFKAVRGVQDLENELSTLRGTEQQLISTNGQLVTDPGIGQLYDIASKNAQTFVDEQGNVITSIDQFREIIANDAVKGLELYTGGLEAIQAAGGSIEGALSVLDLDKNSQAVSTFKLIAGAQGQLAESIDVANRGWEENNAAIKESDARYATIASKLQILKNVGNDVLDTIGDKLLAFGGPLLVRATDNLIKFSDVFQTALAGIEIPELTLPDFDFSGLTIPEFGPIDFSAIGSDLSDLAFDFGFSVDTANQIYAIGQAFDEGLVPGVNAFLSSFEGLGAIESAGGLAAVLGFSPETVGLINELSAQFTSLFDVFSTFDIGQIAAFDFGSILSTAISGASSIRNDLRNDLIEGATALLAPLIDGFVEFTNSSEFLAGVDTMTTQIASIIVAGITTSAEELPELAGVLTGLALQIGRGLAAAAGVLIVVGGQLAAKLGAGFVEYFTGGELEIATVSELNTTLGRISELTANEALLAFNAVGIALAQGIATGLEIGLTALTSGITAISQAIADEFAAFFGIASPSTLFAEFGLNLIQGLVQGIINNASLVADALTGTLGAGIAAVGEGLGTLTEGLELPELNLGELLTGGEADPSGGGIFAFATSIKDGLGSALAETGEIVSSTVAPAFADIGDVTGVFQEEATATSATLTGQLSPALSQVGSVMSANVIPAFDTVAGTVSGNVNPALGAADTAIRKITQDLQRMNSMLLKLNPVVEAFGMWWDVVASNAEAAIEPLTEIKNLLGEIASFLQAIQAAGGGGTAQGANATAAGGAAGGIASGSFSSFSSVQNSSSVNNFNLTVNSQQPAASLTADFGRLQALA